MKRFFNPTAQASTLLTGVLLLSLCLGGLCSSAHADTDEMSVIPMPLNEVVTMTNDDAIAINFSINEETNQLTFNTVEMAPMPSENF
jgi:hypothetical protein